MLPALSPSKGFAMKIKTKVHAGSGGGCRI
jgi:hypothetical protein